MENVVQKESKNQSLMQVKTLLALVLCFMSTMFISAQEFQYRTFTQADSIRGSLRAERTSTDIIFYDLEMDFDIEGKKISGINNIHFSFDGSSKTIQLDLFDNLDISQIIHQGRSLRFERLHNAIFIDAQSFSTDALNVIEVRYSGQPIIARNAPWDGGFVWSEDEAGNPWIAVACEGTGASSWWPNKDHLYDEPDSMRMQFTVPSELFCVSNGNLLHTEESKGKTTYTWGVSYPINNYNVTFNIAKYAHFTDTYTSKDGDTLALDYYVLPENLETAKEHFKQVQGVLEAFEYYFDKYPFWEDGFALVETPYLGMEHQSAIAYGNQYKRGYMGGMIPPEMNWDYIIVHETGHEYFGNSISSKDHAEMWIHESFTTYMEALYVEYHFGYEKVDRYLSYQRRHMNSEPIIGPLGVNYTEWNGSDMYYKGSWILHTLRHVINDDKEWFSLIKQFYLKFKFQNIESEDFFTFAKSYTEMDLDSFFEQYLYKADIPKLEYRLERGAISDKLWFRWEADVKNFHMPFEITLNDKVKRFNGTDAWQMQEIPHGKLKFLVNKFLMNVKEINK